jgi:transposase
VARDLAAFAGALRDGQVARVTDARVRQRIFCVLRGGIAWRLLQSDSPPWQTVYRSFVAWRDQGVFEKINHALAMADRERVGRDAPPSAGSVRTGTMRSSRRAAGARKPGGRATRLWRARLA